MLLAFGIGPAFAATWNVPADGDFDDVWGGAADGDTIVVDAITVTQLPSQLDKRITVTGAGVGATVFDVRERGSPALAVTVAVTLQDLTIDGGDQVALLEKRNGEALTLARVALVDGEDLGRAGGALWIDGGTVDATDTTFTGNRAHEGGAVSVDADGSLFCDRCSFVGNQSDGDVGDGGAVWTAGEVTLTDSTFEGNTAPLWHGGAISVNDAGILTVSGGAFTSNAAAGDGGAIVVRANGSVEITPSLAGPTTFTSQVAAYGSGLSCMGFCTVTIAGATFTAGTATKGGHLYNTVGALTVVDTVLQSGVASADGGAAWAMSGAFTRVRLCDNAAGGQGGGLWSAGDVSLANVAALRNTAGTGGALYLGAGADLRYATLVDNAATTGAGSFGGAAATAVVWTRHAGVAADGATTVTAGATWGNGADFGGDVIVSSSVALSADPLLPETEPCGWPIPTWQGELVGAGPTGEQDPDGTGADLGATGGPDADPSLWANLDGDVAVAMWDCDDADPTVYPGTPDCLPGEPVDTGTRAPTGDTGAPAEPHDTGSAPAADTAAPSDDTGAPLVPAPPRTSADPASSGGCGCGASGPAGAAPLWGWVVFLRRRSR